MLIAALVLAVIGLAALVTAVVTSNELIAWVCIGASVIGVLLLIVDALRERSRRDEDDDDVDVDDVAEEGQATDVVEDYPEETTSVIDAVPNDDVTAATAAAEEPATDESGSAKT